MWSAVQIGPVLTDSCLGGKRINKKAIRTPLTNGEVLFVCRKPKKWPQRNGEKAGKRTMWLTHSMKVNLKRIITPRAQDIMIDTY